MILKTALLIKILLPVVIVALGGFYLRKKLTLGQLLGLGVLVVLFAFAANAVSGLMPPLRDEVTLTALGEKREEASAEEVYLQGYTVDGKEYSAYDDMEVVDGKWFWLDKTYGWRIETDIRQTAGVTRSVTVSIPVGTERTLNFSGGVWRGMLEITAGGNTWTADTYLESTGVASVPIGNSSRSFLIWNQLKSVGVYAAILLTLTGVASAITLRVEKDANGATVVAACSKWIKKTGILATAAFIIISVLLGQFVDRLGCGPGTVVKILPIDGFPQAIHFRGAMVDDVWHHGTSLYKDGDWEFTENGRVCVSVDMTPLTVEIPYGENRELIFNVGPDEGMVAVEIDGKDILLDLYNDVRIDTGRSFTIDKSGPEYTWFICLLVLTIFIFLLLTNDIFKKYKDQIDWKIVETTFFLLLLPTVFVGIYHLSFSNTPKIPEDMYIYGYDAPIFKLIGRGWLHGLLPYRDLFEQKGPLLFFVFMIGEWINSDWGVFLLHGLSLWVTLIIAYFTARKLSGPKKGMLATLATFYFYILILCRDEGGLAEEFNLPALMLSIYFAVKYLEQVEINIEHPPKYAFVYGVACAVSLCMRVTNCVAICCIVLCITVLLLIKKKFENLLKNIFAFGAGIICVVLPFVLYFWIKGALADLLDGYRFQFQYAVANGKGKSIEDLKLMILYLSPVLACVLLSLEKNNLYKASMIVCAVGICGMMYNLALYDHYYMIYITFVPIAMAWFLAPETRRIVDRYSVVYVIATLVLVFDVSIGCNNLIVNRVNYTSSLRDSKAVQEVYLGYRELGDMIPEEDRDKVLGYNVSNSFWLINNIFPCNRFFGGGNEWIFSVWPQILEESIDAYSSLEAEWIVAAGDIGRAEIADVVDEYYEQTYTIYINDGDYWLTLYRKSI